MARFVGIKKQDRGNVVVMSDSCGTFNLNRKSLVDRIRNLQGYGLSTDEEEGALIALDKK